MSATFFRDLANSLIGKKPGYIYIIHCYKCGNQKIGRALNPDQRIKELKRGNDKLRMIHCFWADDYKKGEFQLHKMFADRRIWPKKEWFTLTPDEIEKLQTIKIYQEHEFLCNT